VQHQLEYALDAMYGSTRSNTFRLVSVWHIAMIILYSLMWEILN
jgi:hypothetical protein